MTDIAPQSTVSLIAMTTEIVANYVSGNKVAPTDIPGVIQAVFASLSSINAPAPVNEEPAHEKATASQIRKSVTPDALISFEDGKPYKTLKRHLSTYGLTIPEYKAKWGLPADYPTTAPSYSERRSAMARQLGLGQGGRGKASQPKAAPKGKPRK